MAHVLLGRRLLPQSALVLHQHGSENPLRRATYGWARRGPFVSAYDSLLRATHRGCDLIVVIDAASRLKNERWGLAERTLLLPNAVDLERFQPHSGLPRRPRSEWGLPEQGYVFLHAGRLEEVKRQIAIIEGFERWASDSARQGCLALAGEGSLEATIRERIQLSSYRERIHFLGFMTPEQMPAILRAADCFILASEFEGVPMVLLEAMATGIPVIAPAVGGIPEVLPESTGILLGPSPSAHELSAAMMTATERKWNRSEIRRHATSFGAKEAVSKLDRQFALLTDSANGMV